MGMGKEDKDMSNSTIETPMKINAFAEMRKILMSEMKSQGLTASDIRKELPKRLNDK